jgi:hypothetical protein
MVFPNRQDAWSIRSPNEDNDFGSTSTPPKAIKMRREFNTLNLTIGLFKWVLLAMYPVLEKDFR